MTTLIIYSEVYLCLSELKWHFRCRSSPSPLVSGMEFVEYKWTVCINPNDISKCVWIKQMTDTVLIAQWSLYVELGLCDLTSPGVNEDTRFGQPDIKLLICARVRPWDKNWHSSPHPVWLVSRGNVRKIYEVTRKHSLVSSIAAGFQLVSWLLFMPLHMPASWREVTHLSPKRTYSGNVDIRSFFPNYFQSVFIVFTSASMKPKHISMPTPAPFEMLLTSWTGSIGFASFYFWS